MTSGKSNQLLGDYLIDAGVLNLDELREAANIARTQNLPIGKVLVMSGYLTKEFLQLTIELQSRVKDELLDYSVAIEALDLIIQENMTLEEAIKKLEELGAGMDSKNRLGEFLSAASLVSNDDLIKAIEESCRCGLPLGRVLVNFNMISESILKTTLDLQSQVRERKITKEEAVKILQSSQTESKLEFSQSTALAEKNDIQTQSIRNNNFSSAKNRLKRRRGLTMNRITGRFPSLPSLSVHHILRAAGLVDTDLLEKAIEDALEDSQIMVAILKRSNILEESVIQAAEECCQLIAKAQLKPEQAIIALHHCQRTRGSLHDCLQELGWSQSQ